mgnify:CR=1 FL=1
MGVGAQGPRGVSVLMGPGYVLVGCIGNFLPKKFSNFLSPEMVIFLPLIKTLFDRPTPYMLHVLPFLVWALRLRFVVGGGSGARLSNLSSGVMSTGPN